MVPANFFGAAWLRLDLAQQHAFCSESECCAHHILWSRCEVFYFKSFHSYAIFTAVFRSAKQGAATSINCAVNPEFSSQQCYYYESCRLSYCTPLSRWATI